MKATFLGAMALAALAGCSTQAPVKSVPATTTKGAIDGVVYFVPKAMVQVTYDPKAKGGPLLTVAPVLYGDPQARYVAQAVYSGLADDVVTLGVTGSQLLSTASADTDDKTGEVIATVVDAVRDVSTGDIGRRLSTTTGGPEKRQLLVDPYVQGDQDGVKITPLGASYVQQSRSRISGVPGAQIASQPRKKCPADASLCVPLMVPVIVTFDEASVLAVVPHPTEVIGINMKRAACVKTQNAITIKDGVLQQYKITKPSEVAGCASIPLNIIKAIIAAPFDAITGRTAELKLKQTEISVQLELLKAQQDLAAAIATAEAESAAE